MKHVFFIGVSVVIFLAGVDGCTDMGSDVPPAPVVPTIIGIQPDSAAVGDTVTVNGNAITTHGGNGDFDYLMFVPASASGPANPTVSVATVNGQVVITYTGTLQSSSTVNGTYAPVSGASSPYTVPNTGTPGAAFYRAH